MVMKIKKQLNQALLGLSLFLLFSIAAGAVNVNDMTALKEWHAGEVVTMESVNHFGIKRCFCSKKIGSAIYKTIYKKSYKADCTVPLNCLRYIKVLHYTLNGQIKIGEMICNKEIAGNLVEIFRELFNAHYPIEQMLLIDKYQADDDLSMEHNNTTCFNFRAMTGSKKLSMHALGRAIDINPLYNPYVKRRTDDSLFVSPENGRPYADRSKKFDYKIDSNDLCYKLFIKHGFSWGGAWHSHQDYQHFEK